MIDNPLSVIYIQASTEKNNLKLNFVFNTNVNINTWYR